MLELAERVSELESWDAGRAVLVLGADATFCSGGDLDMMREFVKVPVGGALMSAFMHDTLLRLRRLPMVSAAFLCGRALGAGAEVATACDIRLATERVSIGFIQKKLGLTCGWGSGVRLVQMLGRTLTIELLVRGKVFGWKEAVDIGFVNGVIPEGDDSLEKAVEWLEKWTTGDVRVVRANKHLVSQIADDDMESALSRECKVFDSVWGGDAHRAALQTDAKHK